MATNSTFKFLAQNKKAFVDYEVLEKVEAGIVLSGGETKSAKASHANLKGSFIDIQNGEAHVMKMHINAYKMAPESNYHPDRKRKLLLHKAQIAKLASQMETKGTTIIPLDLHLQRNFVKITIGICRAKKHYDRRNELKRKSQDMEVRRTLKRY